MYGCVEKMLYKISFTKSLEKKNKKETDFIFMNIPFICLLFRDKVMALKIIKNVDKYREAAKLEVDLAFFFKTNLNLLFGHIQK